MKYSSKDVYKGNIIGNWMFLSGIKGQKIEDKKWRYTANVKCLLCGREYDKPFRDILNGKSTKCKNCHNPQMFTNEYFINEDFTELKIKNNQSSKEYVFIIDTKHYPEIKKMYWGVIETSGQVYARSTNGRANNNKDRLHRYVCELEYGNDKINGKIIDHINRNTLDNRVCNLNVVSNLENAQNSKIRKDNSTGVKGINFNKRTGKWIARIQYNKKRISLGSFDTFEQAVKARKEAEKKYHQYASNIKGGVYEI